VRSARASISATTASPSAPIVCANDSTASGIGLDIHPPGGPVRKVGRWPACGSGPANRRGWPGRDGTPDLEGFEAELVDAVSREEPWSLVERFADLERVSGSEDERQAAYLCDRLDDLGIDYERHEPELYRSAPLDASLVPDEAEGAFDVDVEAPAVKTVSTRPAYRLRPTGSSLRMRVPRRGSTRYRTVAA